MICGIGAAEEPERLTTDTAGYCAELQRRVLAEQGIVTGAEAMDVKRLSEVGRKLCDQGEIRFGIAHLRTAVRIIHHRLDRTATGP